MKRVILAACLALPVAAEASRVLSVTSNQEQVTVSYDERGPRWKLDDPLCLFQNKRELACGFVGRLTRTEVVVKMTTRSYRLVPGLTVQLRRDVRLPSSESGEAVEIPRE